MNLRTIIEYEPSSPAVLTACVFFQYTFVSLRQREFTFELIQSRCLNTQVGDRSGDTPRPGARHGSNSCLSCPNQAESSNSSPHLSSAENEPDLEMVSSPPSAAAKSQLVEPLQKRAVGFTHAGLRVLQLGGGLWPWREPAERRSPGGKLSMRVGLGREQGTRLVARFCGLLPPVFPVFLPSVLQDRPACAQTLRAASQKPTAVTDHRHTHSHSCPCVQASALFLHQVQLHHWSGGWLGDFHCSSLTSKTSVCSSTSTCCCKYY